jgi:hypothetical protein
MTIVSRNSLTEVFRNHNDFDFALAAREVIILKVTCKFSDNHFPNVPILPNGLFTDRTFSKNHKFLSDKYHNKLMKRELFVCA